VTGSSTHLVEVADDLVVKRFRSWDRGEHRREWRALNLLAEFAPGLAPAPVDADLDADPPSIRMTRVPGEPLAGQALMPYHLDAIAAALNCLHTCVPPDALAEVPPQPWRAEGVANHMRALAAEAAESGRAEPVVREALDAALGWLALAAEPTGPITPVFGQSDGNLANLLWDGERVRLVDFEDSGRSDRAFELASLSEHVSVWHDNGIDAGALLDRFDLTAAESVRVAFFRRAFAIFWLFLLRKRATGRAVLSQQADRLLGLLATANQ
jgi:Ser/Thr protein kinase RdoA (MazF antagonist)